MGALSVRNDAAGDFLLLFKEWAQLCKRYVLNGDKKTDTVTKETGESSSSSDSDSEPEEYEVEKLVDICYGDPKNTGEHGLKFKVHWKGYSNNEDTWEPAEELSNCQDALREFVTSGFKSKILPLPGGVGVICGGPKMSCKVLFWYSHIFYLSFHRVLCEMATSIVKSKKGGDDVIQTYVFWNGHEPVKGQKEMQKFVTKTVDLMREAKLFCWQGGPIIMLQIENEYGDAELIIRA